MDQYSQGVCGIHIVVLENEWHIFCQSNFFWNSFINLISLNFLFDCNIIIGINIGLDCDSVSGFLIKIVNIWRLSKIDLNILSYSRAPGDCALSIGFFYCNIYWSINNICGNVETCCRIKLINGFLGFFYFVSWNCSLFQGDWERAYSDHQFSLDCGIAVNRDNIIAIKTEVFIWWRNM